jgi:hypothetical protein
VDVEKFLYVPTETTPYPWVREGSGGGRLN